MALKASPEDQAKLLELQSGDTKIAQLDHRARSLGQIASLVALESESGSIRQTFSEQSGRIEDISIELNRIESDVATVEARIKRDSERLEASSSVKDVAALEQELTALRKRLNDLEEIELTVMERMEDAQNELSATTVALTEFSDRVAVLESSRDEEFAVIAAERLSAHNARDELALTLPADLLALYEKQRARYGTGASLLRGGVSLASGVKLLENEMQGIRAAAPDDVLMCPSSEAILVRTDESGL